MKTYDLEMIFFYLDVAVQQPSHLLLGLRQFNSLQNDVSFRHLGQKLWEKMHF